MAAKTSLVDLPAPCLLAIMRHCSSDAGTLCSAAQAHSSLRSAAATAHTSITLHLSCGRHLWSLLRFLTAHGQHVRHLALSSDLVGTIIRAAQPAEWFAALALQFPPSVQLESLALDDMRVSLISGSGGQHSLGVLGGQSRLQTLSLKDCVFEKTSGGLAAALKQLPALQDLTLTGPLSQKLVPCEPEDILPFPGT
jgi:hypothetical protein